MQTEHHAIDINARRYLWLMKQVDAGNLCVAKRPYANNGSLSHWDGVTTSDELNKHIDNALRTEDVLATWVESSRANAQA